VIDEHDRQVRWRAVSTLRPMLLRVALAQGVSIEDAEDAVQEALLRAVTSENLDMSRAEAWLTRVTQRLCIDMFRRQARDDRIRGRLGEAETSSPSGEDAACDHALGAWAIRRAEALAPRERDVLFARAAGHDAAAAARILGLTYKSAESAYTRARAKMQAAVRAALGALGLFGAERRRRTAGASAVAVTAPVVVLLGLHSTLGWSDPSGGGQPHAARPPIRTQQIEPAEYLYPPPPPQLGSVPTRPAAVAPAATPARAPATTRDVVSTRPVRVGPVHHDGARAGWERPEESFEEAIERCLNKGVEITPERIGCRE